MKLPPPPPREALYRRAHVREIDAALARAGVPTILLMENAGRGAAEVIVARWTDTGASDIDGLRVTILCGPGNNGGDGFGVARHLLQRGASVRVLTLGDPARYEGDAASMRDAWIGAGGGMERLVPGALESIGASAVVVDGLFGTGLSRPLEGAARSAVDAVRRLATGSLRVALDVPSGLDADSGSPIGGDARGVFAATDTVTFAHAKPGLFTGEGRTLSGRVQVVGLGVPLPRVTASPDAWSVRGLSLRPRSRSAHKGDAGRVLIIGGSPGTVGAAWLAARGAHRMGAGLVTVASRAASEVGPQLQETMTLLLPADPSEAAQRLLDAAERADCLVVGPGLGRDDWSRVVLSTVLQIDRPCVVDGDGLTVLAERGGLAPGPVRVLTPHPLEMSRLLGLEGATAVNADRWTSARVCADRYGAVVVLKGAGTIVDAPSATPVVVDHAEPVLAVAGSGDVLAGMVGARLAERAPETTGEAAVERTLEAVVAHALAGRRLAERWGTDRGVLAHEIADAVPRVLAARRPSA